MTSPSPTTGPCWRGQCNCSMYTRCTIWTIWSIKKIFSRLWIPLSTRVHHRGLLRIGLSYFPIKMINRGGIVSRLASFRLRIGSSAMFLNFRIGSCHHSAGNFLKSVRFTKETGLRPGAQGAVSTPSSPSSPSEARDNQVSAKAPNRNLTNWG